MKRTLVLLLSALSLSGCTSPNGQSVGATSDAVRCAQNWRRQGFDFDPNCLTCSEMWERAAAVRRATYWNKKGYVIDPNSRTSQQIDQKVDDIERASYWRQRGYNFDHNTVTAQWMDEKAQQLDEVRFWKQLGYFYDPVSRQVYLSKDKRTVLSTLPTPGAGGYLWSYFDSSWSSPGYSTGSSYSTPSPHRITSPLIGENGTYYGQISENTGRPKTVYVGGYYRRDGTYVRSHFRSK